MKESATPSESPASRPLGGSALPELELPVLPAITPARAAMTLDRAIELSALYRQWFALSDLLQERMRQPRCEAEFVL